jgi:anti-sigma B factor antagonist
VVGLARIEVETKNDVVVARLGGEIDISNVSAVRRRLTEAVPNSARGLVLDVSGAAHLDSSGVFMLFELAQALGSRQQLITIVAPESALGARVLYITGLDKIVPFNDTVDEAVKALRVEQPQAPSL